MATVEVTKDVVENQFYDILLGKMSCDEATRSCLAGTWRVNYVDDLKHSCVNRPKVVDAALTLHTTSNCFLYKESQYNNIYAERMFGEHRCMLETRTGHKIFVYV